MNGNTSTSSFYSVLGSNMEQENLDIKVVRQITEIHSSASVFVTSLFIGDELLYVCVYYMS